MCVCMCTYVCVLWFVESGRINGLTNCAYSKYYIFYLQFSLCLSAALVYGLAHDNFRDEVGVRAPTQDSKLFLLVGPQWWMIVTAQLYWSEQNGKGYISVLLLYRGIATASLLDISNSVSHLVMWHNDKDTDWKAGESFFDSRPRRIIVSPTAGSEPRLKFNQSPFCNRYLWHSPRGVMQFRSTTKALH
jgi:hypothetical protein